MSCQSHPAAPHADSMTAQADTFISAHTAAMDICQHPSVSVAVAVWGAC